MLLEDTDDMPHARAIGTVLEDMRALSVDARLPQTHARMTAMFEEALSLLLEVRVPRMPETDDELREMLRQDAGDVGRTYSSEEVFSHLEAHRVTFATFLGRYKEAAHEGRWTETVALLLPDGGSIGWGSGSWKLDMAHDAATLNGPQGGTFSARGPDPALAALGAIMDAHLAVPSIWRR